MFLARFFSTFFYFFCFWNFSIWPNSGYRMRHVRIFFRLFFVQVKLHYWDFFFWRQIYIFRLPSCCLFGFFCYQKFYRINKSRIRDLARHCLIWNFNGNAHTQTKKNDVNWHFQCKIVIFCLLSWIFFHFVSVCVCVFSSGFL